jgi:hypothetical protein
MRTDGVSVNIATAPNLIGAETPGSAHGQPALSVVYGVVDGLTAHSSVFFTSTSTQSGTTVHQANFLVSGFASGVIQCLLWLWVAWKTESGRNWARVLSSVFFGFLCLGLLSAARSAAAF